MENMQSAYNSAEEMRNRLLDASDPIADSFSACDREEWIARLRAISISIGYADEVIGDFGEFAYRAIKRDWDPTCPRPVITKKMCEFIKNPLPPYEED